MDKKQKEILEGMKKLKDAIEGYIDNIELDEAEEAEEMEKAKKKTDSKKKPKTEEKEAREEDE